MPRGTKRHSSTLHLRSYGLETEVSRLISEGRFELAVLLAQTLLELRVEAELTHHIEELGEKSLGEAALGSLGSYNIGNPRTRRFFESLVEAKLKEEADPGVLHLLEEHNARRNRIAHKGETVDEAAARESLQAVLAICLLVHQLSFRALGQEDELEEEERQEKELLGELDEDDLAG